MTLKTNSQEIRDLRQATRDGLLPTRGSSWLAGFSNMLSKELGEWFRTSRWLWQFLIWLIIINGFVGFILFVVPRLESLYPGINSSMEQSLGTLPLEAKGLLYYFSIGVMGGIIGVIVLAHDEIIQEKQSGTASWILSKPASRSAFILTKLLSNTFGALVFIVALPGLVTLGEIYLSTHLMLPLASFLAGAGVFMLALFFYLSLVILLGVLLESRVPLLGIAFGVMFGGMILSRFIPQIAYVLPVTMDTIGLTLSMGAPLLPMFVSQLIATAILSTVFILVALWRFQYKEL